MKTTVEIDDDLFRQAKVLAAQRGITLRELMQTGLKLAMAEVGNHPRRTRVAFPLVGSGVRQGRITSEDVYRAMNEADEEEAQEHARLVRR